MQNTNPQSEQGENETKHPKPKMNSPFLGFIIGVCVAALVLYGATVVQSRTQNQSSNEPQHTAIPGTSKNLDVQPIEFSEKISNEILFSLVTDNQEKALPQKGIENASIVWELATEGGITRLLSVFERSKLPVEIGPVRSARTYFNDIANAYGGVYLHSGGNVDALDELKTKTSSFLNLDEFSNEQSYFRSLKRKAPHNLFTGKNYLEEVISQNTERFMYAPRTTLFTTSNRTQSEFGTLIKKATIVAPGGGLITLSWNSAGFTKQEYGDVWGDEKGNPYVFDNVGILIAADASASDPFTPDSRSYNLTSGGRFILLREQYAIEGEWNRNQKKEFIFTTKDSSQPLGFKDGKTIFFVVSKTLESGLSIESQQLKEDLRLPILMYHYISTPPKNADDIRKGLSVGPELFRAQMEYLKKNEFTPITFLDLLPHLSSHPAKEKKPLPLRPIILTFDDGYRDFFENAYPTLKEFNFKAVSALPIDYANRAGYLTTNQITELDASGLVEFIPHTLHHIDLTDKKYPVKTLKEEIFDAKTKLEALVSHAAPILVYPFGNYNDQIIALTKEALYSAAVGAESGDTITNTNLFHIPRVRISGTATLDQFKRQMEKYLPEATKF